MIGGLFAYRGITEGGLRALVQNVQHSRPISREEFELYAESRRRVEAAERRARIEQLLWEWINHPGYARKTLDEVCPAGLYIEVWALLTEDA